MRNEHVLQLDNRKCTPNSEHSLDEKLVDLVKKKQKPFEMKNLLKEMRKPDLGLERFGESKIKRDMDRKELKPGAQIWVYHDGQSNPCNLVARWNAYAHVVIYIGEERGTHEVVHISKASWTRGLMKAKIRRQPVDDVIKPGDQVILGHRIPECQVSANLRDEIVRRAKKCTEKPSIVFDYHYR